MAVSTCTHGGHCLRIAGIDHFKIWIAAQRPSPAYGRFVLSVRQQTRLQAALTPGSRWYHFTPAVSAAIRATRIGPEQIGALYRQDGVDKRRQQRDHFAGLAPGLVVTLMDQQAPDPVPPAG